MTCIVIGYKLQSSGYDNIQSICDNGKKTQQKSTESVFEIRSISISDYDIVSFASQWSDVITEGGVELDLAKLASFSLWLPILC